MPDLTQPNLQIFYTGLSTQFQDALLKVPRVWWGDVATELPSDTELETYGWSDLIPAFEQWVGTRRFSNVPTRYRSLVNVDWTNGVQIPLRKFQDDKHGLMAQMQTRGLARQAAKLRDQQLVSLIRSNPVGFDGIMSGNNVTFFAASGTGHLTDVDNVNSAQQFNDFPNLAFTPSNYSAVRASMDGFIARDGNPYYAEVSRILYPPALEEAVKNVLNSDYIAPALFGGQTQVGAQDNRNNLKGSANTTKIAEFQATQPKVWYAIDDTGPVKPFIVQKRQDFVATYVTDPTHPSILYDKTLLFAMDARFAFDVTMWWYAIRAGTGL